MKKILFVIQNLNINGANKSLLNLLSLIDKEKYCVDLFIYRHQGNLMGKIPSGVNLLPENPHMAAFESPLSEVMHGKGFLTKTVRICAALHKRVAHIATDSELKFLLWKSVAPLTVPYDAAIGWCEGSSHRFVVEKTVAHKKIGWCHIDDEGWPFHYKQQKKLFPKLDYICTVSQRCKQALLARYDIHSSKVLVIHNIMPVATMCKEAAGQSPYPNGTIHILTYARNEASKCIQDAIDAARILYERGNNTHWWILGSGFSEEQYSAQLPYLTIHRPVVNPSKYTKWCDIYVQTSKSGEAWGLGINEAKIFCRPVVAPDVAVFKEQVEDGVTGLIYDGTVAGLVAAVEKLISDKDLNTRICDNLAQGDWSNTNDLKKLYSIIDSEDCL